MYYKPCRAATTGEGRQGQGLLPPRSSWSAMSGEPPPGGVADGAGGVREWRRAEAIMRRRGYLCRWRVSFPQLFSRKRQGQGGGQPLGVVNDGGAVARLPRR